MKKMTGFMKKELVNGLKKVLFAAAVVTTVASVNPKTAEAATAKMDRTKVTCTAKERFTLKVKNTGGKKVKWSSTRKSVATVSKKGVVVAKKAGKATIKAKVGSKTVKCAVTVKKNAKQPWMTTKTKTLHVGESFLLIEGWFTDYESVFSFNDRIATTNSAGKITATGVGTVKILVNRGKDSNGTYRDYFCMVTVVPGTAKACKHCWMSERNSKGSLEIKNYREEGYDECLTCGEKFLLKKDLLSHRAATNNEHSGSMTAGGGNGHTVCKFNKEVGIPFEYCRLCGETR